MAGRLFRNSSFSTRALPIFPFHPHLFSLSPLIVFLHPQLFAPPRFLSRSLSFSKVLFLIPALYFKICYWLIKIISAFLKNFVKFHRLCLDCHVPERQLVPHLLILPFLLFPFFLFPFLLFPFLLKGSYFFSFLFHLH